MSAINMLLLVAANMTNTALAMTERVVGWALYRIIGSRDFYATCRSAVGLDSETVSQAWTATAGLAERHRLTLYDAAYLELAQRLDLPLGTLDRELCIAGSALGIPLLGH